MIARSILELEGIAKQLAEMIIKPSIVLLEGELGVGKTTLASLILKHLLHSNESFTSPTFSIVHKYHSDLKNCDVFHFDLYRVKNVEELYEIGMSEMLTNSVSLIEWPQVSLPIIKRLDVNTIFDVKLSFIDEYAREVRIMRACNNSWIEVK